MKKGKSKRPLDSASVCGDEDPAAVRELLTKVGDKWSIFLILSLAQLPGERALDFPKLKGRFPASRKEC